MSIPFTNQDHYQRIQQAISDEMDVSAATATVAKPLLTAGDVARDIHNIYYCNRVATDNAPLTINFGIIGNLTKFGTVTIPIGVAIGTVTKGFVTEANRIVAIGERVVVGHTQSASNAGDGVGILEYGVSNQ